MWVTVTDQPGRLLAVFVFSPVLLWKGIKYEDVFLVVFAVLLFAWDAFWILAQPPRSATL